MRKGDRVPEVVKQGYRLQTKVTSYIKKVTGLIKFHEFKELSLV